MYEINTYCDDKSFLDVLFLTVNLLHGNQRNTWIVKTCEYFIEDVKYD